jgi:hypothetical protein
MAILGSDGYVGFRRICGVQEDMWGSGEYARFGRITRVRMGIRITDIMSPSGPEGIGS